MTIACILFILITIVFLYTPTIDADVPPPIYIDQTKSGGLFSIASNVSMPEAFVNVTVQLTDSWNYDVNVTCLFNITSQIQQNLTTAFVYPELWIAISSIQNVTLHEFDILVNGTAVEYSNLHFDEFRSAYDLNQTDWSAISDCNFAVFNFSIDSQNPIIVYVNTEFSTASVGHEFRFDYIVDTARGWEGDTHEIVRLQFDRHIDTEIIEYRFYPSQDLDFNGNNYTANVTWDFHISDFEYSRVSLTVQQREDPTYHHVLPPPDLRIVSILIGVMVLIVLVGLRKFDKI